MCYEMVTGWMRDRIVIDNGLVLVHKAPELPGFHQGACIAKFSPLDAYFSLLFFFCIFQKLGIPRIFEHRTS